MTNTPHVREVSVSGASRPSLWARRRQHREDQQAASALVNRWVAAAANVGLGSTSLSDSGVTVPSVVSVTLGCEPVVMVRLLPGQLPDDVVAVADRLAASLGCHSLRIIPRHRQYVRIELVRTNPLADHVQLPAPIETVTQPVHLGRIESGPLPLVLADSAHLIVQGQTQSGKSRWCYGFLSQVAPARDLDIAGSDITGLLLRPFVGTRHARHQVLGAADPMAHARLLEDQVVEMDQRIAAIPARLDHLPISDRYRLRLVVVEEYPGLLEAAARLDALAGKKSGGIRDRIKAAIGRLLAEGAKAGIRVLLITQRAESTIIGGFHRGQAPVRLSFRVEDVESIKMLHPAAPDQLARAHLAASPGYALVSGPRLPLARLRSPRIESYGAYVDAVASACLRAVA